MHWDIVGVQEEEKSERPCRALQSKARDIPYPSRDVTKTLCALQSTENLARERVRISGIPIIGPTSTIYVSIVTPNLTGGSTMT